MSVGASAATYAHARVASCSYLTRRLYVFPTAPPQALRTRRVTLLGHPLKVMTVVLDKALSHNLPTSTYAHTTNRARPYMRSTKRCMADNRSFSPYTRRTLDLLLSFPETVAVGNHTFTNW